MTQRSAIVRLSSKGQIVIPVTLRRQLRLTTGQPLAVRAGSEKEIVFRTVAHDTAAVDEMLRRLRAAATRLGGDPLRDLHQRRRRERQREAQQHAQWRH